MSLKHYLPQAQLERQGMNSCIICSCGSTTKIYLNFPSEEKDGFSPQNLSISWFIVMGKIFCSHLP